jgi:hypothetical protein
MLSVGLVLGVPGSGQCFLRTRLFRVMPLLCQPEVRHLRPLRSADPVGGDGEMTLTFDRARVRADAGRMAEAGPTWPDPEVPERARRRSFPRSTSRRSWPLSVAAHPEPACPDAAFKVGPGAGTSQLVRIGF